MKRAEATFGMGCFWKPDILFSKIPGVLKTEVGYMGGDESLFPKPTYKQVCSNATGYAEVVNIIYNPKKTSFEKLLDIFWKNHDPTQKNRQGLDIGSQYRTIIFYHDDEQKKIANIQKTRKGKELRKEIATDIVPAKIFFKAEDYHQKYLEKNRGVFC